MHFFVFVLKNRQVFKKKINYPLRFILIKDANEELKRQKRIHTTSDAHKNCTPPPPPLFPSPHSINVPNYSLFLDI
jgi:hypothetical protein